MTRWARRAPRTVRRRGGFEVHLDVFEGPFDLLLALISKHKLDITEIALSPGHRRVHRLHPGAGRPLGPGPGQLLPGRRRDPARPQGGPAAAVRRGRRRGGPGPAGGQGPAVRPAAAVPRLQGGRRRSSRARWPTRAAGSRAGCRWSRGSPTCCPRCCSASGRGPVRGDRRRGAAPRAGRRWSRPRTCTSRAPPCASRPRSSPARLRAAGPGLVPASSSAGLRGYLRGRRAVPGRARAVPGQVRLVRAGDAARRAVRHLDRRPGGRRGERRRMARRHVTSTTGPVSRGGADDDGQTMIEEPLPADRRVSRRGPVASATGGHPARRRRAGARRACWPQVLEVAQPTTSPRRCTALAADYTDRAAGSTCARSPAAGASTPARSARRWSSGSSATARRSG